MSPDAALGLPDDADDLRGFYFRLLLGKASTWVLLGLAVAAAAVAGGVLAGAPVGAAAAVGIFLVGLLVVFAIADSRSEGAFFEAYGEQRGMTVYGKGRLPEATPLLRKGDKRYAERALEGPLDDGTQGTLALYTYEDETTDGDGNRQTNYYRYTIGLAEVPECAAFVPELYCQRKSGLRALEKFEDVFRRSKERVKLESEALDERYEIFAGKAQDANHLRQLFSPTFIVWLTDSAPKKFAFELVDGTLCCYVHGHKKKADELDAIRLASAAVATRLREEATE
ncbi:MAG TPA: hypothetical protein VLK89_06285 [Solirubrobacterales bacterium]|nr:hypothetical protein [Solirubrobacterales bacterium]